MTSHNLPVWLKCIWYIHYYYYMYHPVIITNGKWQEKKENIESLKFSSDFYEQRLKKWEESHKEEYVFVWGPVSSTGCRVGRDTWLIDIEEDEILEKKKSSEKPS